jgi:CRP-like cAMP-binding protein
VAADHDLCAAADSCFIALPVAEVQRCCALCPEIYPWIMQDIGQRLRLLMEWTSQSVLVRPEQRMAKLIHILARDQKIGGVSGTLHVTQMRLAALARCSRQSANTLLGALERRGLIRLTYGKCEIADMAKLATFADSEDAG